MTMETKADIFKEHLEEWLGAGGNRKRRGEIIAHITKTAKVHPKSIPRSFRRVQMRDPGTEEKRGRKVRYGVDVTEALKEIWEVSSRSCAENLHGQIESHIAILRRDKMWRHGAEATEQLLAMSLGLMKQRLGAFVRIRKMARGKSTTRPGSIRSLIPVRSGPWHDAPAGTVQIDTVAHCGDSIAGDFIYTVNASDVPTLWGSRRAQWNKGREQTVDSMEAMSADIAFPVLEWHPDSGSEFVNWHCKRWCEAKGQRLTRSRPNRKNDNCFVEERNGHVIRKWVGYFRLEHETLVVPLNELYDVLTPYLNHFIASRRIISKERIGARWKVTREKRSMTPYERVMARDDVAEQVKAKLRTDHEVLNPLVMKREIDRRLRRVFDMRKHCGQPRS